MITNCVLSWCNEMKFCLCEVLWNWKARTANIHENFCGRGWMKCVMTGWRFPLWACQAIFTNFSHTMNLSLLLPRAFVVIINQMQRLNFPIVYIVIAFLFINKYLINFSILWSNFPTVCSCVSTKKINIKLFYYALESARREGKRHWMAKSEQGSVSSWLCRRFFPPLSSFMPCLWNNMMLLCNVCSVVGTWIINMYDELLCPSKKDEFSRLSITASRVFISLFGGGEQHAIKVW